MTSQSMAGAQAAAAPQQSGAPTPTPQPKYSYQDIDVTRTGSIAHLMNINPSLAIFRQNPMLKQLLGPALDRAVQELWPVVADRAVRAALTTTEHIIKKDYGIESDESKMRLGAHQMVRALTAGMALIVSREPLLLMVQNLLKQQLQTQFRV